MEEYEIPGTAQIRKLTATKEASELLCLCGKLAEDGLDKKLWSVLSRVYEDGKYFEGSITEEISKAVEQVVKSDVPACLKLQLYTSFKLPVRLLPDEESCREIVHECDTKRANIAAHFINLYQIETLLYNEIIGRADILSILYKQMSVSRLLTFFGIIISNENKENITGAIRLVAKCRKKFVYDDQSQIKTLTDNVFEAKEVFFTSKLLFCQTFKVPKNIVISQKTLDKILRISINYEEKLTKDFVKEYSLRFDCSDLALCQYYLNNKKASNEKGIVLRFAYHLNRLEDEQMKKKLLRGAYKRGGYFRMYAGCMQDGYIDMEKMKRFHYSSEDVAWCSALPGLNDQ